LLETISVQRNDFLIVLNFLEHDLCCDKLRNIERNGEDITLNLVYSSV